MLQGRCVVLRARVAADVAVLHAGLHDDVATRVRADARPWRPMAGDAAASPYAVSEPSPDVAGFTVVHTPAGATDAAGTGQVAGDALLWGIDSHNRSAHLGISLLPAFRGLGLATDVLHVLCGFGFTTLGLHRLQVDTLSDNAAMIATARRVGFVPEARFRSASWVSGRFLDDVALGLLDSEWTAPQYPD